jgi:hypothetical protein
MTPAEIEDAVGADMRLQREWVEKLSPDVSLLKFRLPWTAGRTSYIHGRILLQAFGPCTSTETRLLVTREDINKAPLEGDALYDNEVYERRMMHHNTVDRPTAYHGPSVCRDAVSGLDRCYDCTALVATVKAYMEACRAPQAEDTSGDCAAVGRKYGACSRSSVHTRSSSRGLLRRSRLTPDRRDAPKVKGEDSFLGQRSDKTRLKRRERSPICCAKMFLAFDVEAPKGQV